MMQRAIVAQVAPSFVVCQPAWQLAMVVSLPTHFPPSAFVREDKLQRCSAAYAYGSWLSDEAIDLVQQHLTVDESFLPREVLIVEARTAKGGDPNWKLKKHRP